MVPQARGRAHRPRVLARGRARGGLPLGGRAGRCRQRLDVRGRTRRWQARSRWRWWAPCQRCLAWWWPHQWRQALWAVGDAGGGLAWAWVRWLPCASRLGSPGAGGAVGAARRPRHHGRPIGIGWLPSQPIRSSSMPLNRSWVIGPTGVGPACRRSPDMASRHLGAAPLRVLERATASCLVPGPGRGQWRQTMQSVQMDRLLAAGRLQTEDGLRAVQAQLAQVTQLARVISNISGRWPSSCRNRCTTGLRTMAQTCRCATPWGPTCSG